MALPAKPIRKAANTGNDKLARPTAKSVPGKAAYIRKAASPADASKKTYVRKGSGISPEAHNVNRPNQTGGKHLTGAKKYNGGSARNGQPFNNKGGQKMSRKMKGVD